LNMAMEKVARGIPASLWNIASEKLIDITLNSSNASKMPSDLAKTILYYWQRDQLATEVGLHRLLEASMILEPEKTISLMEELGLPEIVVMLKETL
jgi:hypothetical protein